MLQLNEIKKRYEAGEFSVDALKGVSLNFRKSEFVSILGPSGCGKTTMLNIIGGLDKYTSGDLIINGKSTKNFTDRDWDAYRNHSIGFVFQSYNLIPHQTVLANVELALALSGVKKAERTERAKEALDKVGLKGMYKKRPCEMSGGQMQRVAIARAIVNNPDIILADEPTGALDTETSIQVMDILKEISNDRLVIMVTHNPELAEKYSTRIVKMLDGLLVDDSKPLTESELQAEQEADAQLVAQEEADKKAKVKKPKKPKMSFGTQFMLSLKNLFTKRGRTVLTSFAGSIGIIGIALIFAVSQGTTNYIAAVQEDTLASYPLTIEQSHTDMGSMFSAFVQSAESGIDHAEKDKVYEKLALYNLTKSISQIEQSENDLAAYKKYLDKQLADKNSKMYQALNGVHYRYDLDLLIYTKNAEDGSIMRSDTTELMQEMIGALYGVDISSVTFTGGGLMSSLMSSSMQMQSLWQELLPAPDGGTINKLIKDQYQLIHGNWPASKNQVLLVVDDNREIDDMTLYALGLKSRAEIDAIIDAARKGEKLEGYTPKQWSFEEICSQTYKTIFNYECYQKGAGDVWYDVRSLEGGLQALYNDPDVGMDLEVVGIIAPNPDASSHMLSAGICYTQDLTLHIMEQAQKSDIAKTQKDNPQVDIFTGKYFKNTNLTNAVKAQIFRDYVSGCSDTEKAQVFIKINSVPTEEEKEAATAQLNAMDTEQLRQTVLNLMSMSPSGNSQTMQDYINGLDDAQLRGYIPTIAPISAQLAKMQALLKAYPTQADQLAKLEQDLENYDVDKCAWCYEQAIEFSDSSYDDNLVTLGCLDAAEPAAISLYAVSFEAKDVIEQDINAYNKTVPDAQKIRYTDYVGLIMSSVTTIIDAITYVLIGFVSISLIVSSIMIGVITLISVQERTKEIGILRAIGASKRNVSGMFNAETGIIGFISGLFGVLVTYILCIFVNIILHAATGIMSLNAVLPPWVALILIAISMLLTLIAGIIPSRSAAKKDPVVALRTE
ncbi:MAG: ABC transporter ATP-binding protein/permease [Corallococcus sp.]|nr:ABC transporter ATP-binding protein/permease [Corallococcus sp.]MCM1360150.1 ABC transporter ATP-binding protein/permease [Corallococcus sp.]MCM1395461.1 ABC transporter ATP-binding protein/permease [Corallococcus sp.]